MYLKIMTLVALIGLMLTSCNQTTLQPTPSITSTSLLTPYHTTAPGFVVPTATRDIIIPVTPAPSPTPFMHTVKKDETMLGIAFLYGVSLEDLKAANPGVDPRMMSVGIQLVIPIGGEIPDTLPTPTPMPVEWQQPACYRAGDGGAWCILAVKNILESSVENLSAWIGLYTPDGTNIASHVAYAPLNLLRPGDTIPLMVYFAPPLDESFEVQGEFLSGIAVAVDDTRYLDLEVIVSEVDLSTDGRQATVRGEVILPEGISIPSQLWTILVAYDAKGTIIGARRWESGGETSFMLPVFSLEGVIDHIEVLVEARP